MADNQPPHAIPYENIRGLTQELLNELDRRVDLLRRGTRYEKMRRSDIRIGMLAYRQPRSMAEIARFMGITRQAVHAAVKRLMDLEVVELVPHPTSARDKLVAVTEKGWQAQSFSNFTIKELEEECASIIGKRGLEQFRVQLLALVTAMKVRHIDQPAPPDDEPSLT